MEESKIKRLCISALLIAMVCICTMVIQIPVPATGGYIHLGDSVILVASIFFGWKYGLIAGSLGSAMADLLTGYAYWAPFTLVIKAVMGLIIGRIGKLKTENDKFFSIRNILASLSGILCMVVGYLIGGTILKGSFTVALTSVPSNLIQGFGGLVIFYITGLGLYKVKAYKLINE